MAKANHAHKNRSCCTYCRRLYHNGFFNSVNRPSVVIFCMVRPSNYGQNQTFCSIKPAVRAQVVEIVVGDLIGAGAAQEQSKPSFGAAERGT
jgi:hypothetical protein